MQSFLAIFAGFMTSAIFGGAVDYAMRGLFPDVPAGELAARSMLAFVVAYTVAIDVLSGWVTGRIAPFKPLFHGAALALISLLGGLMAATLGTTTVHIISIGLSVPAILLGAHFAGRHKVDSAA